MEALYRATNKYLARETLDAACLPNVPFGLATDDASETFSMRPPLILNVDTVSFGLAQEVLDAAARRGIATAIVCPPGGWRDGTRSVARIVETNDFGFANLERIASELENEFEVRGVHTSFGSFRDEGFVHEAVALVAAKRGLPPCSL